MTDGMTDRSLPLAAASPRTWLRTLWDAALARPSAQSRAATAAQTFLILLWQPAIFVLIQMASNAVIAQSSDFWYRAGVAPYATGPSYVQFPSSAEDAFALAATLVGVWVGAVGVVAYIPYRIVARGRRQPFAPFVRCWWRTCLWGVPLLPAGAYLIALLPPQLRDSGVAELGAAIYLIAGPAVCAARETRRRGLRMSRWRPVCPECGYSLRRLESNRCPECGEPLPTTSRVFRRWAVRRLPWDRRNRGSLPVAYFKTILLIVFCPCRAARGLLMPDRYGRAVRWALFHVLLLAIAGVAFGSQLYFMRWARDGFSADAVTDWGLSIATALPTQGPSRAHVTLWAMHSLSAWLVSGAAIVVAGLLLGTAVPCRHPLARRAIAKWSLYAGTATLVPGLLCWSTAYVALSLRPNFASTPVLLALMSILWPWQSLTPVVSLTAPAYGIWWAAGVCRIPYLRTRGLAVFAVHAIAYQAVWLLLSQVLFPCDALASLL